MLGGLVFALAGINMDSPRLILYAVLALFLSVFVKNPGIRTVVINVAGYYSRDGLCRRKFTVWSASRSFKNKRLKWRVFPS